MAPAGVYYFKLICCGVRIFYIILNVMPEKWQLQGYIFASITCDHYLLICSWIIGIFILELSNPLPKGHSINIPDTEQTTG